MRCLKLVRCCLLAAALLASGAAALFAYDICFKVPGGTAYGCRGDDKCRRLVSGNWECVPRNGGKPYPAAPQQQSGFGLSNYGGGAQILGMSQFGPLFSAAENIPVKNATVKSLRLKAGYYTQAIQAWKESDGRESKAAAYANRGFVRALLREYDAAENDFNVAINNNPGDPLPHNYLGHLYYTQQKYEQAVLKFRRAFSFGLEDSFPKQANEARRLHDSALKILEDQKKAAAAKERAEQARKLEQERLERAKALVEAAERALAQSRSQAAPDLPVRPPDAGNQYGTAQDQPARIPQARRPDAEPRAGRPPPAKSPWDDWARYLSLCLFITLAVFLAVTGLLLKGDQDRMRRELGPLAKELGVDVKWLYFGLFIPPDTDYHSKLMVSMVLNSVLGVVGIFLAFYLSAHHETAVIILGGWLFSATIIGLLVHASYSMRTVGRSVTLTAQSAWTPAAPPPDYEPTFTEGTVLPDVPIPPETTGRTMKSSASRARQIRSLMDGGKYGEALELFSRKSPLKITDADRDQLFEIYLRLGDFDRAGNLFDSLKNVPLLADNLPRYEAFAVLCRNKGSRELSRRICRGMFGAMKSSVARLAAGAPAYYRLGLFCEGVDDGELARDIYRHMLDSGFGKYRDTAARYEELKNRLFVAVAAPAPGVPAAAAAGGGFIGQVLNNQYELKGELGEGGMAKVYEGLDRKTRKKVAVKKMHPWLKKFPEEHKRFVQEAKIVSRLTHPNIVGVQAIVEQEGEIYLIFDYVDGKTLADVLKEKGLVQFQESKKIFRGVCEAVRYAHKANVIHRDLKPSNIMITKEGQALVMDFGLASELRESLTRVTHQTTSGTPAYMAPEQYVGVVKRESDIYAMGVCLYELLTGKLPFVSGDVMQLKNDREYRPASAELPWLPAGLDDIISRALAPEPSQRFADPMDLYDALDKLG